MLQWQSENVFSTLFCKKKHNFLAPNRMSWLIVKWIRTNRKQLTTNYTLKFKEYQLGYSDNNELKSEHFPLSVYTTVSSLISTAHTNTQICSCPVWTLTVDGEVLIEEYRYYFVVSESYQRYAWNVIYRELILLNAEPEFWTNYDHSKSIGIIIDYKYFSNTLKV